MLFDVFQNSLQNNKIKAGKPALKVCFLAELCILNYLYRILEYNYTFRFS